MTDTNRNTRTLIVSFVIGLGVLVPLRFLAEAPVVGNDVQVLGVQNNVVLEPQIVVEEDIFVYQPGQLEAPYDEIDGLSVR